MLTPFWCSANSSLFLCDSNKTDSLLLLVYNNTHAPLCGNHDVHPVGWYAATDEPAAGGADW